MDWRHRAACLTEDPELFFPIGNTGPALMQIAEAKKVCRRCDVRHPASPVLSRWGLFLAARIVPVLVLVLVEAEILEDNLPFRKRGAFPVPRLFRLVLDRVLLIAAPRPGHVRIPPQRPGGPGAAGNGRFSGPRGRGRNGDTVELSIGSLEKAL